MLWTKAAVRVRAAGTLASLAQTGARAWAFRENEAFRTWAGQPRPEPRETTGIERPQIEVSAVRVRLSPSPGRGRELRAALAVHHEPALRRRVDRRALGHRMLPSRSGGSRASAPLRPVRVTVPSRGCCVSAAVPAPPSTCSLPSMLEERFPEAEPLIVHRVYTLDRARS